MARFKDFDAAEAERSDEPIVFRLGGRDWVVAHVNAANFLKFARQIAKGGNDVIFAFDDYVTGALEESQREDFHKMLDAKDVQLFTLTALGTWIVEQATGNPTDVASPSPVARSKPTGKPRRVSLDPVSTPKGSLSVVG
jgi:hypothetical protein